jgi:hypothetical protein
MTTIKIKSAIQEADISKRLRQFQDDLLKLKLIKKGQDPVQELEGDSGNYIITVELDKTPKELLPLLESLGVPYEGTKYFDNQEGTLIVFKNKDKYKILDELEAKSFKISNSSKDFEEVFKGSKEEVEKYCKENNIKFNYFANKTDDQLNTSFYDNNKPGWYVIRRGDEFNVLNSKNVDFDEKLRGKSFGSNKYGPYDYDEALAKCEELKSSSTKSNESKVFSNPTDVTIKYCTPDGNVGTVAVPSTEAHQKMKELASIGCTKVRITNDEHYTRDNGPRSEVKEEHEFEEMFSALRTRLENAPNDIKQHFNNLINYFSNK